MLFKLLLPCLLFFASERVFAQTVLKLYPGKAPGSETWTYNEQADTIGGKAVMVFNVSQPTLTVYTPDKAIANGTAVIICPGGAFHVLSMTNEGTDLAKWLTERGITAFILKYRLWGTNGKFADVMNDLRNKNSKSIDSINAPVVPLAVADGVNAVKYVRTHAAEYNLKPGHIGIIGFSAGGTVATSVAQTYDAASRPDFVAGIYTYAGAIMGTVQKEAPPLFMAMANDDPVSFGNADLYKKWRDAGALVEMHIYPKGGHGFGMNKQNLPSDKWIDAFRDWLVTINQLSK